MRRAALGQEMPGGAEQLVPLGPREDDVGAGRRVPHALGGRGPQHDLHPGGCRVIHAVAIAIGSTPYWAASRSITAFSSAYSGLPRKTPASVPLWNGDHACTVMPFSRQ